MELVVVPDDRHKGSLVLPGPAPLRAAGQLRPRQRMRAAQRLEKAQEAASAALSAVSSYLGAETNLPAFFRHVSETVTGLVGARRAAFWRLSPLGILAVQADPYGFPAGSRIRAVRSELALEGDGIVERVVFRDELFLDNGTCADLDDFWRENGLRGIKNSIAVSWRAGDRRIGALAAYDKHRGFDADDIWVLRMAAMAAGLVWQYKETEEELDFTVVRLEEAMAALRHLLANVASDGGESRRRFASALHDDSLQLLTAAELQLERIRISVPSGKQSADIDALGLTLKKVEDSLRRLLTNVSPESLGLHVGLREAIRNRIDSLRTRSGSS